ncbi:MAG: SEC-C metal-binding domain-containing protein [Acidimicrobiia bacterium]|nr:SEC-C metal-binding domain-containing protein [Acidimicrobiia bacterium]
MPRPPTRHRQGRPPPLPRQRGRPPRRPSPTPRLRIPPAPPTCRSRSTRRRDATTPCHCGSGRKYKHCHGR